MRKTETHVIGETTYLITQLGAKDGRDVLARIIRKVGVAAGAPTTEEAVGKFAAELSDTDLAYFCDKFSTVTQFYASADPSKVLRLIDQFDEHFAGNYGGMTKWLWASLQTNYASFLGEWGISPGALQAMVSKATTGTPPTSPTPPSGASSSTASGG